MTDPDVPLLLAARAVVVTYDEHVAAADQPGQGVLWDAHVAAIGDLAVIVSNRPEVCPYCGLPIGYWQINEKGRHLLCAIRAGTLTVQCRSCMDGRIIGQVGHCAACGRERA